MTAWASMWVDPEDTASEVRIAMVEMWSWAATNRFTANGPIAHMIASRERYIRRQRETRGSYLPVAAPLKVRCPTEQEVTELVEAYAMVATAASHYAVDWNLRCDLQTWLRSHMRGAEHTWEDRIRAEQLGRAQEFLTAAAAALDDGIRLDTDEYRWYDSVRRREFFRTMRWRSEVIDWQRKACYGAHDQVHDHGPAIEDDADGSLAGDGSVRDPEPVNGVG